MKILVIGGTGTVGSAAVKALAREGVAVRVATRSEEKIHTLPPGVEGMVGDPEYAETLPALFQGVDSAFVITPLHERETEIGLNIVDAAKNAGLHRLVYLTVHRLRSAPHIPHFASKMPVEDAIRASGIPYTFVEPNNYYQNDLFFREALMHFGVYPQPLGNIGLSRVDVRDIADVAAIALTRDGHEGRHIPLAGPDVLTSEEIAGIWSRHLGFQISCMNDLDAWEEQARQSMPDWLVHDLRIMYGWFQENGLKVTEDEMDTLRSVLGREPRSYDAFVRETVAAWYK